MFRPLIVAIGLIRPYPLQLKHHISIWAAALVVAVSISSPSPALAFNPAPSAPAGLDISWPQCATGIPTLTSDPTNVVVGVTGGRAFTHNPCLAAEYQWSVGKGHQPDLYLNLNYPSHGTNSRGNTGPRGTCQASDATCQAFNYGYNDAKDAVDYAGSVMAGSTKWWLDVETENFWSSDTGLNRQVIQGAVQFFTDHQLAVGVYSIAPMWRTIAGNLSLGLPLWVAQTDSKIPATVYCASAHAFAGGSAAMVQSWNGHYDVDYGCPGVRLAALVGDLAAGTADSPLLLTDSLNGSLAPSEGGTAEYVTFPNVHQGSHQTLTLDFGPHGPDVANGVFLAVYQNGSLLTKVHAIDSPTPGTVTLTFSSQSPAPFVAQLMDYNAATMPPIQFNLSRSG